MVKDAPDGYVKSPYASLRCIHRHCDVRKKYVSFLCICAPCLWNFYKAVISL